MSAKESTRRRTNNLNGYYHGVVVKLMAQHAGHDPRQIHELPKQKFSPKWHRNELAVPTSTTRLDTIECVEYTERCRLWANELFGFTVPFPGEVAV